MFSSSWTPTKCVSSFPLHTAAFAIAWILRNFDKFSLMTFPKKTYLLLLLQIQNLDESHILSLERQKAILRKGYWSFDVPRVRDYKKYWAVQFMMVSLADKSKNRVNRNIPRVEFGPGVSNVIRALQKLLKVTLDGNFGSDTYTDLQRRMGTLQDGENRIVLKRWSVD